MICYPNTSFKGLNCYKYQVPRKGLNCTRYQVVLIGCFLSHPDLLRVIWICKRFGCTMNAYQITKETHILNIDSHEVDTWMVKLALIIEIYFKPKTGSLMMYTLYYFFTLCRCRTAYPWFEILWILIKTISCIWGLNSISPIKSLWKVSLFHWCPLIYLHFRKRHNFTIEAANK